MSALGAAIGHAYHRYRRRPLVKDIKRRPNVAGYTRGRQVLNNPRAELKAFDVPFTNQAFALVGSFNTLNTPVNGSEIYQRVGRKIYMKSLHIRGLVTFNAGTSLQDNNRILLIYDTQTNAAAPNLATVLQDSNAAAGTSVLTEINLANRQRFKILKDVVIPNPAVTFAAGLPTVGVDQPIDNCGQQFNINWFIKLRGLEVIFNGTNGGTTADIQSGSLLFVTISGNNNSTISIGYTSRLRYYD